MGLVWPQRAQVSGSVLLMFFIFFGGSEKLLLLGYARDNPRRKCFWVGLVLPHNFTATLLTPFSILIQGVGFEPTMLPMYSVSQPSALSFAP